MTPWQRLGMLMNNGMIAVRVREVRLPEWLGWVFGLGLVAAIISLYIAGDWRNADVSLYHAYALGFWGGLTHPILPTEYPPLSIVPLSLTLAGPAAWFPDVFAFWMGVIAVLGYAAFRRWTTPRQAGAYALYVLSAGVATLLFRFDLIPALLATGAIWLAQRRRFARAYGIIGIATLMKLFPLVLLPVIVIAHSRAAGGDSTPPWRSIALGAGGCLAIVCAGFGVAAALDPHGWTSSLLIETNRPLEVESVPATLLWFGSAFGFHLTAVVSFDSFNLTGALSSAVIDFATATLILGLMWVYWRQVRGDLTVAQAATAAVLVLLCGSKVLSSQYLLWLAPLLATAAGFQFRWLAVFLLTALIFPGFFEVGVRPMGATFSYAPYVVAGLVARNVLLVALTVLYIRRPGIDPSEREKRPAPRERHSALQAA
ncbi:MAG: glycosyltransferase 87 family protein [Candidatus Dormibacteria bacterium]